MTGRQIPAEIVKPHSTEVFMAEAGLLPPTTQRFLCATCAAEGIFSPPDTIVFVSGTTFCTEHV